MQRWLLKQLGRRAALEVLTKLVTGQAGHSSPSQPAAASNWPRLCRFADAVQRRLLEQLGRRAALEVLTRLVDGLQHVGDLAPEGLAHSALLPLADVLLRWFAAQQLDTFRQAAG